MPRPTANPADRFSETTLAWEGEAPAADLEVFEERARSILSSNESPDLGFRWSVNPYRGCYHGCAYCYARPTHPYLGHGAGTDFERKLVVKVNAPELLREAFERPSWIGETVVFSGNTDCYQPLEAHHRLTRRLLEVCLAYRNPVGIITKGALIRRDLDLLSELARRARCRVTLSIAFDDDATRRALEPWASPIEQRFEVMRRLADAGVPCGISLAPIIPGLNDSDVPALLTRAKEAGATHAFMALLRLPGEVLPVFDERLGAALPLRHARVMNAVRELRGGALSESGFGRRFVGKGPRWQIVERLFETHARRLGLVNDEMGVGPVVPEPATTFERPRAQLSLF